MPTTFLTARWESLILLNYACPSSLLTPLVPAGVQLDSWNGETVVSLVGFLFANTRVLGIPIPFHRTFEEVNLRFYVRRAVPNAQPRRGVVFIRELVPRRAIAAVARWTYNEPYIAVPMTHRRSLTRAEGGAVAYSWRYSGAEFGLGGRASGPAQSLRRESQTTFITEHYWGYTRQRDGGTIEYQVEHPPWDVWDATESQFQGPGHLVYGAAFGAILANRPMSAYIAVGSQVVVHRPRRL